MDVAAHLHQMGVALDDNGREAATEDRPIAAVAIIDPLGETATEETHRIGQTAAFAEQQQIFYALTLLTTFTSQGVDQLAAISFLEKSFTLGVIRNLKEEEYYVFNVPRSYQSTY